MKSKLEPQPAMFTPDQEYDCIRVAHLLREFPQFKEFAQYCHLSNEVAVAEEPADALRRLAPLNLGAKLHFLKMGEVQRVWGGKPSSHFYTVSGQLDGHWDVAVELMGPKKRLVVSWLLAGLGHYVEAIASGKGYLGGRLALRGTSFDTAVALISRSTGFPAEHDTLRQAADSFVGCLNGVWLGMASGFHERHMCVDLLMRCVVSSVQGDNLLATTVQKHAQSLARVLSVPNFYHRLVQAEGWQSEKGMCGVMDAATTELLVGLHYSTESHK